MMFFSGQAVADEAPTTTWFSDSDPICGGGAILSTAPSEDDRTIGLFTAGYGKFGRVWRMPVQPQDWSLEQGDEVPVVLYLSGFEELVPTPHVLRPEQAESYHLHVTLHHKGSIVEHGLDPDPPTHGRFGEASQPVPYTIGAGTHRFDLTVPVEQTISYQANDTETQFLIFVRVHGGMRVHVEMTEDRPPGPIEVHIGPEEQASHTTIPGFPVASYRASEARWAATGRCEIAPGPQTVPEQAHDAPLPTWTLTLLFLLAWATRTASRRPGRP